MEAHKNSLQVCHAGVLSSDSVSMCLYSRVPQLCLFPSQWQRCDVHNLQTVIAYKTCAADSDGILYSPGLAMKCNHHTALFASGD